MDCFQINVIPMSGKDIDSTGTTIATRSEDWYSFPEEVQKWLGPVLLPFGYETGSGKDAGSFLLEIEYMFRKENSVSFPWAIVFMSEEYPLAGHLMSIRPSMDIRFSCYSLIWPGAYDNYDVAVDGPPKVSIVFVFSKLAVQHGAASGSPLLQNVCNILSDKAEDCRWVVLADPLNDEWVRNVAKTSDELFFTLANIDRCP